MALNNTTFNNNQKELKPNIPDGLLDLLDHTLTLQTLNEHNLEDIKKETDADVIQDDSVLFQDGINGETPIVEVLKTSCGYKYSCLLCYDQFTSVSNLELHLNIHFDVGDLSNKTTIINIDSLLRNKQSNIGCYSDDCDFVKTELSLTDFLKQDLTTDNTFQSSFCNFSAVDEVVLEQHVSTHNDLTSNVGDQSQTHALVNNEKVEPKFKCILCLKCFNIRKALDSHVKNHERNTKHTCMICNFVSKQKSSIRKHIQSHINERRSKRVSDSEISLLVKRFETSLVLNSSTNDVDFSLLMYDVVKNMYKCTECNFTSTQKRSAVAHCKSMHATTKTFACNHCQKQFSSETVLATHKQSHVDYKCLKCAFTTKQKDMFESHASVHKQQKSPTPQIVSNDSVLEDTNDQQQNDGVIPFIGSETSSELANFKYFTVIDCNKIRPLVDEEIEEIIPTQTDPLHIQSDFCDTFGDAPSSPEDSPALPEIAPASPEVAPAAPEVPPASPVDSHKSDESDNWVPNEIVLYSSDDELVCTTCKYLAPNASKLQRHIRTHNTPKPNTYCKVCRRSFATSSAYISHAKTHNKKPVILKQTTLPFSKKGVSSVNNTIMTNGLNSSHLECTNCKKVFVARLEWLLHLKDNNCVRTSSRLQSTYHKQHLLKELLQQSEKSYRAILPKVNSGNAPLLQERLLTKTQPKIDITHSSSSEVILIDSSDDESTKKSTPVVQTMPNTLGATYVVNLLTPGLILPNIKNKIIKMMEKIDVTKKPANTDVSNSVIDISDDETTPNNSIQGQIINNFQRKVQLNMVNRNLVCTICNIRFTDLDCLQMHMKFHSQGGVRINIQAILQGHLGEKVTVLGRNVDTNNPNLTKTINSAGVVQSTKLVSEGNLIKTIKSTENNTNLSFEHEIDDCAEKTSLVGENRIKLSTPQVVEIQSRAADSINVESDAIPVKTPILHSETSTLFHRLRPGDDNINSVRVPSNNNEAEKHENPHIVGVSDQPQIEKRTTSNTPTENVTSSIEGPNVNVIETVTSNLERPNVNVIENVTSNLEGPNVNVKTVTSCLNGPNVNAIENVTSSIKGPNVNAIESVISGIEAPNVFENVTCSLKETNANVIVTSGLEGPVVEKVMSDLVGPNVNTIEKVTSSIGRPNVNIENVTSALVEAPNLNLFENVTSALDEPNVNVTSGIEGTNVNVIENVTSSFEGQNVIENIVSTLEGPSGNVIKNIWSGLEKPKNVTSNLEGPNIDVILEKTPFSNEQVPEDSLYIEDTFARRSNVDELVNDKTTSPDNNSGNKRLVDLTNMNEENGCNVSENKTIVDGKIVNSAQSIVTNCNKLSNDTADNSKRSSELVNNVESDDDNYVNDDSCDGNSVIETTSELPIPDCIIIPDEDTPNSTSITCELPDHHKKSNKLEKTFVCAICETTLNCNAFETHMKNHFEVFLQESKTNLKLQKIMEDKLCKKEGDKVTKCSDDTPKNVSNFVSLLAEKIDNTESCNITSKQSSVIVVSDTDDASEVKNDSKPDLKKNILKQQDEISHESSSYSLPYKCSECAVGFKAAYYLSQHQRSVHSTLECTVCYKKFLYLHSLQTHYAIYHNNVSVSVCFPCNYYTTIDDKYKEHMKNHNPKMSLLEEKLPSTVVKPEIKPEVTNTLSTGIQQCSKCEYSSTTSKGLSIHDRLVHGRDVAHNCKICKATFPSILTLKTHMDTHSNIIKCLQCKFKTKNKEKMKSHVTTHVKQEESLDSFACNKCTYTTSSTRSLIAHAKNGCNSATHTCATCNTEFATVSSLKVHMKSHVFNCVTCEYFTNDRQKLNKHMDIHLDKDKTEVNNTSESIEELITPAVIYKTSDTPRNTGDNSRMQTRSTSRNHQRIRRSLRLTKTSPSKEQIIVSRSLFVSKKQTPPKKRSNTPSRASKRKRQDVTPKENKTKRRRTTQNRPKTHNCTRCNIKFRSKTILKVHLQLHTLQFTRMCTSCNYKTESKRDFSYHFKDHRGLCKFVCSLCKYSTMFKYKFKLHIVAHTGERPYKCKLCSYRASSKGDLYLHLYGHLIIRKKYKCKVCNYRSQQKRSLLYHMKGKGVVCSVPPA